MIKSVSPSEDQQRFSLPQRSDRPVRLAYVVSHPIQYQVPLLRRIHECPSIDLTVFFGSDFSLKSYKDEGFGIELKWDVPLLGGYKSEFLPTLRDTGNEGIFSPINYGIYSRLAGRGSERPYDALWVHGYTTILQLQAILCARLLGIPVLLRADSRWIEGEGTPLHLFIKKLCFGAMGKIASGALAAGKHNADYFHFYMGEQFPVFLMPYAVDNDWFQQQSKLASLTRDEFRKELGLQPGRPVILFASKLQRRKHCSDLVEAYLQLAPPGQEPHPYLLIVGDGEERAALERQVAVSGSKSILFCGFRNQKELPRFFDLASVFVLPASTEPWGLVVNEVMNAARAVIVSDQIGCQPDLITDGVEGCVYPTNDIPALTQALHRVLDQPETAEQMGLRGLERIKQWSFEQDVEALVQALDAVRKK